jgi:ribosome-associated protein
VISSGPVSDLHVTSVLTIPEAELRWVAVRASGPGGQNVNKVASKVELRFDFTQCGQLSADTKARLGVLAAGRLDAEGKILITSQTHRDQPRNLEDAREKLAALIRAALFRPKARRKTKPSRASKERRLDGKRRDSQKKATRRERF